MGHAPATIDEKGRLKVPANFRKILEERYGTDCFITSMDGERALVYPMPVWVAMLERLTKVPSTSVARNKMLERLNYYGKESSIDGQGRVLMPTILREVAKISDDVVVLGSHDHLEVWNGDKIRKRVASEPLTAEDLKELELHGV